MNDAPDVLEASKALFALLGDTPRSAIGGPDEQTFGLEWTPEDTARMGRDPSVLFPFPDSISYNDVRAAASTFTRTVVVPTFVPTDDLWDASNAGEGVREDELYRLLDLLWRRLTVPEDGPLATLRRVLTALLGHGEAYLTPRIVRYTLQNGRQGEWERFGAASLESDLRAIWREACKGADALAVLSSFDQLAAEYTLPTPLVICQRSLVAYELRERDRVLPEASALAGQYISAQLQRIAGSDGWEIESRVRRPVLDPTLPGKWRPLREFIAAAMANTLSGGHAEEADELWRLVSADDPALAHCLHHEIDLDYLHSLQPQTWSDVRRVGRRYRKTRRGAP